MKFLGVLTASILTLALAGLAHAYTGIQLYHWFMLPVGAPDLTTAQLYGVMFFIGFLRYREQPQTEENDDSAGTRLTKALGKAVFVNLFLLGLGWAIHTIIY